MKTLEEQIEDLKRNHEKQLADAALKVKIAEHLPGTDKDWSIHLHQLYGRVGSITRKTDQYNSTYGGARPWSPDDLAESLKALPPLPMAKAKGTFVSFIPVKDLGELKETDRKEVTELSVPLEVRMTEQQPGVARFTWFTVIEGVGTIKVEYEVPWQHRWMYNDWRKVNFVGGFRYEKVGPIGRGIHIGYAPSHVSWWSSPEYIGDTSLYWTHGVTLEQVIAGVKKAHEQQQ